MQSSQRSVPGGLLHRTISNRSRVKLLAIGLMAPVALCTMPRGIVSAAPGTALVNTDVLRLRSGPGTSYSILGRMTFGESVKIYAGAFDGWYQVEYGTQIGWTSGQYLDIVPPTSIATATVTTGTLRLRSGPGTTYTILTNMYQNEGVSVVDGPSNGWYQISYKGTVGWASGDYLDLGDGEEQPPEEPGGFAHVTTAVLNLRSGPGTGNSIIGRMLSGETVELLDQDGVWYKVDYKGLEGWAHGDYLELGAGEGEPETPASGGYVNVSVLNLRSGAGTSNAIVEKMLLGETVTILDHSGAWYQVKHHGTVGWAHGDYLTLGGDSASFWVPVHQQEHTLSCEYASLQIATEGLGKKIAEDTFIPIVGFDPNPHIAFRGNIDGAYASLDDYGVYPEPLPAALAQFGFHGDVFYGDAQTFRDHIKAGHPVLLFIDQRPISSLYMDIGGESVVMSRYSHVVVGYGYNPEGVLISDPDSSNRKRQITWSSFDAQWGSMDYMALAVSWAT
jgi:uncharacterized protein YgiM (DUF1202 family)